MRVIGTAGHIDHGKSSLVKALTGIDPDRLEEEKQRGMTIDLGFAWLTMPSGAEVSLVDVPGHERFVKNMLAGVGGIDLALLVVAADESVMPQTREHLDILDLLGVRRGVVALTKADLVDDEWLTLVESDVDDLLAGSALAGSRIVPVSAVTREGVQDLLEALDEVLRHTPGRADVGLPLLPVDRVFTISGFGTVVTGTLQDGRLRVGTDVELVPGARSARIRGLQTHGQAVQESRPGDRVAVNLAGIERERIARGDVLAYRGSVEGVHHLDARLRVLQDAPFPLSGNTEVMLHVGAAERQAVVTFLEGEQLSPGATGWASIRTAEDVPAVCGQRFILRLPAPARTIAGGEVIYAGPAIRPRARRLAVLEGLSAQDLQPRVGAWLQAARFSDARSVAVRLRISVDEAESVLASAVAGGDAVRVGRGFMAAGEWGSLCSRAEEELRRYHRDHAMKRGIPKEELRAKLRAPTERWSSVLEKLIEAGVATDAGTVVAAPDHRGGLEARRGEADRVLEALRESQLSPPTGAELGSRTGSDVTLLAALADAGEAVRVGADLYLARDVFDRFRQEVLQLIDDKGGISVAQVRDRFGISRKYALALLEHLDDLRITRRLGDTRVRGSRAAVCA